MVLSDQLAEFVPVKDQAKFRALLADYAEQLLAEGRKQGRNIERAVRQLDEDLAREGWKA